LARYLALDWDNGLLHVVSASLGMGGARVERAAVFQETQSPNLAEAEALGKQLRERLKSAGIAPGPVLACVGRNRVIVKGVNYPVVPDSEVPALVRFQALKELTDPPEEVVIDYVLVEEPGPSGERQAHAVILRRELLQAYQLVCKAAGLKLVGVVPRPFGVAACLKRVAGSTVLTPTPEPDGSAAIVTVTESWSELTVVRGEAVAMARFMPGGGNLAGEVRRSLAVYAGQSAQQPVKSLYIAGMDAALREKLQGLSGVGVYPLDPFGGAERPELPTQGRGGFAGAVGLLQLQADRKGLPLNFVKPKQPKPVVDPNRKRLLLGGGVAAAALVGFVVICVAQLHASDVQLEAASLDKMNLDKQLVQVDEDAKRIKALEDWAATEIVWLDELYDLTDRFPDPKNVRLVRLTADPVTRGAKGKYVGRMVLTGVTTDDFRAIDDLMSETVRDGHYRVFPITPSKNSGADRLRGFGQQFVLPTDVEKRASEKYKRRLNVEPPAENGRGKGGPGPDATLGDFPGGQQ
jgi:hypothetical protein